MAEKKLSVSSVAKAVVAGLGAGTSALVAAVADGSLSVSEGFGVAAAVLAVYGITWFVPNAPKAQDR
jgi:hypothetical protein